MTTKRNDNPAGGYSCFDFAFASKKAGAEAMWRRVLTAGAIWDRYPAKGYVLGSARVPIKECVLEENPIDDVKRLRAGRHDDGR
jgi:hypothetical protein